MISLIGDKRAIPLYWQLLDKRGSSNLEEQQALITPILELLKDYEIIIRGDREARKCEASAMAVSTASQVCSEN